MKFLGDYSAGDTVHIYFATNDQNGARVAPSSAFEAADCRIYKNGSATQRTSQAGWTMTSPFDSMTGVHHLSIDLSDDTDTGFYSAGNDYTVVLYPDETVDGQAVAAVLGQFSIDNRRNTTVNVVAGATVDPVDGSRITLYQGTAKPDIVLTVTDGNGDAVDCSSMDLRFLVRTIEDPLAGQWQVDTAGISVGGASNNVVTITYTTTETATAGSFAWELWDDTASAERVVLAGPMLIIETKKTLA